MTRTLVTVDEIERLIAEGAGVDALENLIDSLPIEPDQKAALWLRAWSLSQRRPGRVPVPGLYLG
jgi:hypothetical protein